jgi:hypothetical protein
MGRIGKITAAPEVRRAKNGEADVLMLTVRFSDGGTASVQWMPGAGDDTSPQEGDIVAVERFGGVLIVTASMSPGGPERKTGEREIYSRTADRTKAARLTLKTDGTAELSSGDSSGAEAARLILTDKVYLGNLVGSLCTVLLGIVDQVKNLTTAGAPGAHTVDPAAKANLEAYKEQIKAVLTEEEV